MSYGGGSGYPPHGSGGGYPPQSGGLPGGYPSNPPGSYGDQYGHGLKAMSSGNHMNDVFFAAACCIVVGCLVGGTALLFELKLVEWLQLTYLLAFAGMLAILDTPLLKTIKAVIDAKMYIGKYLQFVTRLTGKGVTLVFLGSSLFLTLWDTQSSGFMEFLAVVLCMVPVLVGLCAIVIGILKSAKLNKARQQLSQVIEQRYDSVAQTYVGPQGGLTMAEFNRLTSEFGGGVRFETLDLKLIFNALVSNPLWRQQVANQQGAQGGYTSVGDDLKIPRQDVLDWCKAGMVLL